MGAEDTGGVAAGEEALGPEAEPGTPATPGGPVIWLRSLAAVALLCVFHLLLALPVLVVVLAAGLLIRGTAFVTGGGLALWGLVAVALVALVTELTGPRNTPSGIAVTPGDEPLLWAFVRDVADDLDVPAPDGVVLTGGTVCEIGAVRRPGTVLRHHLFLGVAALHVLSSRELRIVVGHALGHRRRRRPPLLGALACHGTGTVEGLAASSAGRGAAGRAAAACSRLYTRVCAPVLAFEERAADRAVTRAYGTPAVLAGLTAYAAVRDTWARFRRDHLDPGRAAGCAPRDPLAGFRAVFAASRDDAGPPLGDAYGLRARIGRLRDRPAVEGRVPVPESASRAMSLIDGPEEQGRRLDLHLRTADDDGRLPPGGPAEPEPLVTLSEEAFLHQAAAFWDTWHAATFTSAARRAGAAYPVTLDGVADLLAGGGGPRLATACGGEEAATAGLTALLTCAWTESGRARRTVSWDAPAEVVDHAGGRLGLHALARAALEGPEGGLRLRERLRTAGVPGHYEAPPPVPLTVIRSQGTVAGRGSREG